MTTQSADAGARSAASIDEFFGSLGERGPHEVLARASGTLRFDVADGSSTSQWHITLSGGNVVATQRGGTADAVVRVSKPVLEDMLTGTVNTTAATLRGVIDVDGDLSVLLLFQRLFPGPPT